MTSRVHLSPSIYRVCVTGPPRTPPPERAPAPYATLDPDEIADAVWRLASGVEDEVVFDVLTPRPAEG